MSTPWPPPPDLESLKELFASADIEGLIADGAPGDEYDPEAKHFSEEIRDYKTNQLSAVKLQPLLERLWIKQFMLDEHQISQRRPALATLATQIERFFGPEATPQVR